MRWRRPAWNGQSDILAFTLFVPLPRDVQLSGIAIYGYQDGEPWPGWNRADMGSLIGLDGPTEEGRRPSCRLIFKTIRMAHGSSPDLVDRGFDDLVGSGLGRRMRWRRAMRAWIARLPRRMDRSTGVAITLYEARGHSILSDTREVSRRADDALTVLSEYLLALGMGGDDALVADISKLDLPTPLRYLIEVYSASTRRRETVTDLVGIHVWHEDLLAIPRTRDDVESAAALFRASVEGREPTFVVYSLRQTALREQLAGRYTEAVVAAVSAIEVLVDLVLQLAWQPAGLPPGEQPHAMEAPLPRKIEDHLARVLGREIQLDDEATPVGAWWHTAYSLRKRVIHEGIQPSFAEGSAAIEGTYNFMAFVGAALRDDPRTREVLPSLPTSRRPNRRYAGLDD